MKLQDARQQFISSWGALGSQWGINRTMAQIHALLLVSSGPVNADYIMTELNLSRGNVNMNLHDLISWGLIEKTIIPGDRKDYFIAEKDIWKAAMTIAKQRKQRELDPMFKILDQLTDLEEDPKDKDVKQFNETIAGIQKFASQADRMLDGIIKADQHWFTGSLLKLFK